MQKQLKIILTERKARALIDGLYHLILQNDELYEKNKIPRTKQFADDLNAIRDDLMHKLFKL